MKTGDHVQWCFSSLDKNIEFSVLFISKDQFVKTVVPLCFVESKSSLITGEWECINDGCVRLVFDNSKSSWYSCSVSYEVTIRKKEEQSEAEVVLESQSIWDVCWRVFAWGCDSCFELSLSSHSSTRITLKPVLFKRTLKHMSNKHTIYKR